MAFMYSLSPVDESILGLDFMEVVVLAIGIDAGVVVFDGGVVGFDGGVVGFDAGVVGFATGVFGFDANVFGLVEGVGAVVNGRTLGNVAATFSTSLASEIKSSVM